MTTGSAGHRRGWADRVFVGLFVGYALGGLLILSQGLLAVAASVSPTLHEAFHLYALGSGPVARISQRVADASHSVPSLFQVALDYTFTLAHLAMAAILLWLRPRDWTARLLSLALVGAAGVFNLTSQATFERLPMTGLESLAQVVAHAVAGLTYVYALLLFPDGRPVPFWRPRALIPLYSVATIATVAVAVRVEGIARPAALLLLFGLAVPAVGAAAQGYRLRRTTDNIEHAQARLVFWALLPSVGFGLAYLATHGLSPAMTVLEGRHLPEPPVALYRSFQPAFALIPLALFAGLLRYRLWDMERLLRRTIVYAVATGLLAAAYASFVLAAQLVLGRVAATPLIESRIAVAITTLVFVSVFRPVRDRVQAFLERRFNRGRYDPQATLERFSYALRDEIELQRVAGELESVLACTVQPAQAWLWLCDGQESSPDRGLDQAAATVTTSRQRLITTGNSTATVAG